jgi:hypothetical protein
MELAFCRCAVETKAAARMRSNAEMVLSRLGLRPPPKRDDINKQSLFAEVADRGSYR